MVRIDSVGSDRDADGVDRERVLRHWTARERRKRDLDTDVLAEMDEREVLAELMQYTDGEERPLWRPRSVDWYHVPVRESWLRTLRVVASPDGLGWNLVAPDERVVTAARRIRDGRVTDETTPQVDVATIERRAAALPRALDDLVVVGGQTARPPRVVDGNHRAVAVLCHLLAGGEMPDMRAYVGVVESGPLTAAAEKTR